jgi:hypothetical protein
MLYVISFTITNTAWVRTRLCKLQKRCIRLAAASDKIYQLLAHGRWFSPGTPASSTTKTDRHHIAEILLKVALNTINQIKSVIAVIHQTSRCLSLPPIRFLLNICQELIAYHRFYPTPFSNIEPCICI